MRLFPNCVLLLAMMTIGNAVSAKSTTPDELNLSGDNIIIAEIKGKAVRLEVKPDAAGAPILNPDMQQRLALKPGVFGFYFYIGPTLVKSNSAVLRANYTGKPQKQRIFWASRQVSTIADGVIGPASLPYKKVIFQLKAPVGGEVITKLPLDNFGFLGKEGLGTTIKARDRKIKFLFSLARDGNLVSAPTGNWIAQNFDGALTGEARSMLILYGVERPVRPMKLAQPILVNQFSLDMLNVRVFDFGDANGIKKQAEDGGAGDSEEIVVVGKKGKNTDLIIRSGRPFLNQCSSITYDLGKREIRLSCKFQPTTQS